MGIAVLNEQYGNASHVNNISIKKTNQNKNIRRVSGSV